MILEVAGWVLEIRKTDLLKTPSFPFLLILFSSASTALAFIELSNRAVMMFHTMAETMYDMLSPGPALHNRQRRLNQMPHARAGGSALTRAQPADFREGVTNAYQVGFL